MIDLAKTWPFGFPDQFMPRATRESEQPAGQADSKVSNRGGVVQFTRDTNFASAAAKHSSQKPYQPNAQAAAPRYGSSGEQPQRDRQQQSRYTTGEFEIAKIPCFQLVERDKAQHPVEFGAAFNFSQVLIQAKKIDKDIPPAPMWKGKQFCLRFMTARCGCKVGRNSKACNRLHVDLKETDGIDPVPLANLKELWTFMSHPEIQKSLKATLEFKAKVGN
jgi:hypothetical protein